MIWLFLALFLLAIPMGAWRFFENLVCFTTWLIGFCVIAFLIAMAYPTTIHLTSKCGLDAKCYVKTYRDMTK